MTLRLNELAPSAGSRPLRTRVGRGIGSGKGKTCGRGHKGQHSRSGGFRKTGFEGGQMPLQRRLPKIGFKTHKVCRVDEIRLHELNRFDGQVDIEDLRKSGLISNQVAVVKIINSGELKKALTVVGLAVTKGARIAIEAVGGSVKEK